MSGECGMESLQRHCIKEVNEAVLEICHEALPCEFQLLPTQILNRDNDIETMRRLTESVNAEAEERARLKEERLLTAFLIMKGKGRE